MNLLLKTVLVEWKLTTRNFLNIFFSLIFPVMMLLLFGSMYGNDPSPYYKGHGSVDVSTPGYICMIIAVSGLMTLPITLSQYRERKILKRFMATPIKPLDILMAQLVVNAIVTFVGSVILIIIGILVFDLKFYGNPVLILISSILIMTSIFSIGLFIAGFAKNAKAALAISYIIYFPMLFLSGATIPLEFMPSGVITLSKIFPLTYGIRLLRGLWLGESITNFSLEIIVLLGVFIVLGLLSLKTFKWE